MAFGKKLGGILKGLGSVAKLVPGVGTAVGVGFDAIGGVVDALSPEEEARQRQQRSTARNPQPENGLQTQAAPNTPPPVAVPTTEILGAPVVSAQQTLVEDPEEQLKLFGGIVDQFGGA